MGLWAAGDDRVGLAGAGWKADIGRSKPAFGRGLARARGGAAQRVRMGGRTAQVAGGAQRPAGDPSVADIEFPFRRPQPIRRPSLRLRLHRSPSFSKAESTDSLT